MPDPAAVHLDGATSRPARSRGKLLAAATALLVESGPDAVTVDAVAERSGVAKSTLYRHWSSRDELLLDVMRTHLPAIDTPDLGAGFDAALRTLVAQVAETCTDPEWASVLVALIALQQRRPELTELFAAERGAQLCALGEVVAVGIAEGRLPTDLDVQMTADVLFGPLLLATICGDRHRIAAVARYSVDRFLASYPTVRPSPTPRRRA